MVQRLGIKAGVYTIDNTFVRGLGGGGLLGEKIKEHSKRKIGLFGKENRLVTDLDLSKCL